MDILNSIINVLKTVIIPLGVTFRVIYCLIKMMYSEDEFQMYKKRMINIIIFGVLAEVLFVIKDVIIRYFG